MIQLYLLGIIPAFVQDAKKAECKVSRILLRLSLGVVAFTYFGGFGMLYIQSYSSIMNM